MSASKPWVVVKFGGSSVTNLNAWANIKNIIVHHLSAGTQVMLVCSAPQHTSDNLQQLLTQAAQGDDHTILLATIKNRYITLCHDLDVDPNTTFQPIWEDLERCIQGIALLNDTSPKNQAKVMAFGELLLTQIACQHLIQQGITTQWMHAGSCLRAQKQPAATLTNCYLSALCESDYDQHTVDHITAYKVDVVITQGFIAHNDADEIVLLGRGGSDISAAYFAAKLGAQLCELWTDVPGIYTTNPHTVPEARHITQLTYDEAQEIALMGAQVLHPRTIAPLQKHAIPLSIRHTKSPDREGTTISNAVNSAPVVKAVSVNRNVILLSIEALSMWQKSGFLADIFACFKLHDLSIDLISTSQSNVTLSLDIKATLLDPALLERLVTDLKHFARVKVISPCATISIIGSQVRKVLYQINDIFLLFRTIGVHLVSQASNDLSFTIVVDEEHASRLSQLIHDMIIENSITQRCFGLSYAHEFSPNTTQQNEWWQTKSNQLLDKSQDNTPIYLYNHDTLQQQAQTLLNCQALDQVFYAMKANANKDILTTFYQLGLGFECVSIYEVQTIFALFPDIAPQRILFTPNFAAKEEYAKALEMGIYLTIDNLHPLTHWPELFQHQSILLRVDPGFGEGHHQFVETGGDQSKFGLSMANLDALKQAIQSCNANIIGLHAHSGSGIMNINNWERLAHKLISLCEHFPTVRIIDLGGGLGIPDKHGQPLLDIQQLDTKLAAIKTLHPGLAFWMEPGRFLTAESGVLCARVTQVKQKSSFTYIGIDAGMHTLIRPALYGAYHQIINLTRMHQPTKYLAHIVGPICESGDIIGHSRWMPETQEGDIILIATVGAYGSSMSSQYNLRPLAQEAVVVD